MTLKINFLKNMPTLSERDYENERGYLRYTIVMAIVAVILMIAVFGWQFFLTKRYDKIEERISESNRQLIGMTAANAQQIYLKSRLKLVEKFMSERSISREAIQKIFSLAIPGVMVSGVTFEGDNMIKMQTTADDVLSLANLVDYFEGQSSFFIQIVSQGISRSETGQYQMNLLLTLPKES